MLLRSIFTTSLLALTLAATTIAADTSGGNLPSGPPACQDCISHRCVLVPEKKQIKITVYEVHEVPYCLKKLPPLFSFHKHCDDCAECDCVRYKKVLVKKEIVCDEICATKCVPQPCGK